MLYPMKSKERDIYTQVSYRTLSRCVKSRLVDEGAVRFQTIRDAVQSMFTESRYLKLTAECSAVTAESGRYFYEMHGFAAFLSNWTCIK